MAGRAGWVPVGAQSIAMDWKKSRMVTEYIKLPYLNIINIVFFQGCRPSPSRLDIANGDIKLSRKTAPIGGRSLVEVAGVEPASKKRGMEGRYRLGPDSVTSAGGRTTLIEDVPPSLGCRQEASRQPIPSHPPADRSHPLDGLTSPLPGDDGDSFVRLVRRRKPVQCCSWLFCFYRLDKGANR